MNKQSIKKIFDNLSEVTRYMDVKLVDKIFNTKELYKKLHVCPCCEGKFWRSIAEVINPTETYWDAQCPKCGGKGYIESFKREKLVKES